MKQTKVMKNLCVEEITVRIRNDGILRIVTMVTLSLSTIFVVVTLGVYLHDHAKMYLTSEDLLIDLPLLALPNNYSLSDTNSIPAQTSTNRSSCSRLSILKWATPNDLWHSMSDEELMWRASMVPQVVGYPYNRTPKVAFMFLSRGRLPLAPLWEKFFNGPQGLYSIYLHTSPEFVEELPESSVFYKRRIPSQAVQWGRSSMMDAERRLLANALLDFSNERFVLLSESCIPLFNFTIIYTYLVRSNLSFLGSFDDPRKMGRGRYNKRMWPTISLPEWRKGNQWFEIHRSIAIKVVSDRTYHTVFGEHCNPPCYMDEHYLPTLVTKLCPNMNSNRSITWVDWSRGGSHPTMFKKKDVSETFLNQVRFGYNCTYNNMKTSLCFFFARKFHPSTLEPLLRIAPQLLGFDP